LGNPILTEVLTMPFTPKDKNAGDVLKSQDWNAGMQEILRLNKEKVDRKGDVITGFLSIGDALKVLGNSEFKGSLTVTDNHYLSVKGEAPAGTLRVGAAWGMPGLYSGDSPEPGFSQDLTLGTPKGKKVYLGFNQEDAYVESGTGNAYLKGKVGIGTTDPKAQLQVTGIVNITSGSGNNIANMNNRMAPGSLTIGGIDRNYGGGNEWNANTAGLLLETLDNTEIAVHDSGTRIASLMYYESATNKFTIGRDMGWGKINTVQISGALSVVGNSELRGNVGIGTSGTRRSISLEGGTQSPDAGAIRFGDNTGWKLHFGRSQESSDGALNSGTTGVVMTIQDIGNVGIGTTSPIAKLDISSVARSETHPAAVKGLYVTGDFGADSDGIEFRHTNGTQGIGFGYNTIYATGGNPNQDLGLKPKGDGKVNITAKLHVQGTVKTRLDVIQCLGRGDWNVRDHPVAAYFRGKLTGEPAGTMMMAICDLPGWERIVWQGYVSSNGQIWVNHLNWANANANVIGP
jgi:hypothetical protein